MLLAANDRAKVADVGLARFMPNDYLSSQAAVGTFAWAVRVSAVPCENLCILQVSNQTAASSIGVAVARCKPVIVDRNSQCYVALTCWGVEHSTRPR